MSFDAGALIFKIKTAGYQTFEQQMQAADRTVQQVGKSGAEAAPKVEKTGSAVEQTGKKAKDAAPALDAQAKSTKKVGDESASATPKQEKQKYTTEQQADAAKKLAAGLTIAGVAVAAMVALSVAKWTEFDQAMSNTSAAVMASAQEQKDLSEAALKAGADTAYSASEAAAAEEELAKAGQSVSDIVGGSLNGALALAAAGQLQVARSAEVMATTLTQFRLPASQAAHVSDVLAAGAGKAQGSVDDLALALSYVGPLAGSVGLSLDETAGTIAYFATQGIIGEKAGTALRGVLAGLQAPSAAAQKELDKYNITAFDANGNMLSLAGIAEQLRGKLSGLTEQERLAALGRIFGNESLNAATLLYEGGSKAISKWTDEVNDSGYAAEQARERQNNLAGDIEKLGGAMDTALIRTGSGANDVLREMVQAVTSLVDWFGELPGPVVEVALGLGVATGAALLLAGAAVGLRVKFIELKAQLDATSVSMGKTALVGGIVGVALTGVVAVVALLAQAQAEARARAEAYADALSQSESAARKFVAEQLAMKDSFLWMDRGSAIDNAKKLGISIDDVTKAVTGSSAEFAKFKDRVQAAYDTKGQGVEYGVAMQQLTERVEQLRTAQSDAAQTSRETAEAQKSLTGATDRNGASVADAADKYLEAAGNVEDLQSKLSKLIDTVNAANGVGQDAITANINYRDSLAKIDETISKAADGVEGYSATLDQGTQSGRDNMAMLVGLADDAQKAADAQFALDGNTDAYRATLESSRQTLIDRAEQLGYNADEAANLADQIFRIPSETQWKIITDTAFAQTQIDRFVYENSGREVILKIGTSRVAQGAGGSGGITQADGGIVTFHANGSVRENHVAQIARAGEWRVWAEPETDGESYVPHARSKRARSEQVMAQTAEILGGTYIPAGARPSLATPGPDSPSIQFGDIRIEGGGVSAAEVLSMIHQAIRGAMREAAGG
ncbi:MULTISPECIES: phage tail tape measure protein [unclassified Microbacterium]|uniref:phage tail tape measure protein n=1 Tax=unclassified Microbacterium TaxID=2609290 RepID=UPI003015BFEA